MIEVRKASQRGRANFGWLDSRHTFSFGSYFDPKHMGFSELRVINDDTVAPSAGFETHSHRDMEIISFVLEGTIAHKDSEGNIEELPAGEFQLMSAGKGISHSEFNASSTETLKFLQIWIQPNSYGGQPGYQQKDFGRNPGLTTIATPTGENGTLKIKQDAVLHQLILEPGSELSYQAEQGRRIYVHQVNSEIFINDTQLTPGDGAKVTEQEYISFYNNSDTQATALVFDLP